MTAQNDTSPATRPRSRMARRVARVAVTVVVVLLLLGLTPVLSLMWSESIGVSGVVTTGSFEQEAGGTGECTDADGVSLDQAQDDVEGDDDCDDGGRHGGTTQPGVTPQPPGDD